MSEDEYPIVTDFMDVNRVEPEVVFPVFNTPERLEIHVHKAGGGYMDVRYSGRWFCNLVYAGELIHSTQDLEMAMPYTHYGAAGVYAGFLANGEAASDVLVHVHEDIEDALSMFAMEAREVREGKHGTSHG